MLHITPSATSAWLIWVRWKRCGATEAANAKAKSLMAKAGQLSPSPLAGISQSEGAALET